MIYCINFTTKQNCEYTGMNEKSALLSDSNENNRTSLWPSPKTGNVWY